MNKHLTIRKMIDAVFQSLSQEHLTYGHGTDNPWDEAVALVLQVLKLPFDIDEKLLERQLTAEESQKILDLLERRIKENIPLAYLTNEAYFAGLSFYVDERVIIPRSPIAELIKNGFSPWIKAGNVRSILDLCAGSSCIAIVCAKAFPQATIDAVELSDDALQIAKINIKRHNVESQVKAIKSDLFEKLSDNKYDVIVSNPPYVSHDEFKTLPKEYHHEPKLALKAKDNGLDIVIRILKQAANHLTKDGVLIVEVGNSQYELEARYPKVPFMWLEFEHGGNGIFLLTAQQLRVLQHEF